MSLLISINLPAYNKLDALFLTWIVVKELHYKLY